MLAQAAVHEELSVVAGAVMHPEPLALLVAELVYIGERWLRRYDQITVPYEPCHRIVVEQLRVSPGGDAHRRPSVFAAMHAPSASHALHLTPFAARNSV